MFKFILWQVFGLGRLLACQCAVRQPVRAGYRRCPTGGSAGPVSAAAPGLAVLQTNFNFILGPSGGSRGGSGLGFSLRRWGGVWDDSGPDLGVIYV